MYLLINTMSRIGDEKLGNLVSRHRTMEAAEAANGKLQRSIKRSSPGAYVPTRILQEAPGKRASGSVMASDVVFDSMA